MLNLVDVFILKHEGVDFDDLDDDDDISCVADQLFAIGKGWA